MTHDGRFYRMHDAAVRAASDPGAAADPDRRRRTAKTLPLVARHADLWNAYGTPGQLAAADTVLRERVRPPVATARYRADDDLNVVMRAGRGRGATPRGRRWRDPHDLRPGRDDLDAGGSPDDVAVAIEPYRAAGFEHVIFVFRSPFDLETIDRLPELRGATGG